MKTTKDVRKYAAEQGIAEEEALKKGWKKSPKSLPKKEMSFMRKRDSMASDDPFVRYSVTALYHFTDRNNLPLIRQLRGLFSLNHEQAQEIRH